MALATMINEKNTNNEWIKEKYEARSMRRKNRVLNRLAQTMMQKEMGHNGFGVGEWEKCWAVYILVNFMVAVKPRPLGHI